MAFIYKSEIELYAVHFKPQPPFPETLLTSYDNNSYMTNCHGCQHDVGWAPRSGRPGGRSATLLHETLTFAAMNFRWTFLRFEAPAELSPEDIHQTPQMFLERRRALSIAGLKTNFSQSLCVWAANQRPAPPIVKWKMSSANLLKWANSCTKNL